jgi:cell division protein FtsZ
MAFVFLPFDCECNWRLATAQAGLSELRQIANLVMVMPNQNALKLIDSATSLLDTFKTANRLLVESLRAACRALTGQTVMGMPFSDLCIQLRQHSADCIFAVAEASGPNRAKDALERLLAHPMLEGPGALPAAEAVAFCILGGANLPMAELTRIMEQVQGHCQGAPAMMGASLRPDTLDTLTLGVLVARAECDPNQQVAETSFQVLENQSNGTKQTNHGPQGTAFEAATDPTGIGLLNESAMKRAPSRFAAPAPELPQDKLEQIRARQGANRTGRKPLPKLRQSQLPLEIISKGRFDNSEPTVHKGEDLDVPTYIRRGVTLN